MFSLIVTVVAIILVVLLAAAAIYYGGVSHGNSVVRSSAVTLISQGNQIHAAGVLSDARGAGWPAGSPYFTAPYLSAMPVPPVSAYVTGTPSDQDWEYYSADGSPGHFVLKNKIREDVCMEVNRLQGLVGIPAAWTGTHLIQCFGPGVPVGEDGAKAYTFFFDPSVSPKQPAIDQSVTEAVDGGADNPRPGYPRRCPDGSVITEGLCPTPASEKEPVDPEDSASGYLLITASAGVWDVVVSSGGYSKTCPSGAINPASAAANKFKPHPNEPFAVDGAQRLGWELPPDYQAFTNQLTRTWCIPADEADDIGTGVLADGTEGDFVNVSATPVAASLADDSYFAEVGAVNLIAKGQPWSIVAVSYYYGLDFGGEDGYVYIDGDKVAIGRGVDFTETYFAPSTQPLVVNGVPSNISVGKVVFEKGEHPPRRGLPPTLACSGSYTDKTIAASCTLTTDAQNAAIITEVTATAAPALSREMTISNCLNTAIPKNSPCTFVVSGERPGSGAAAVTLNVSGTYGASGVENTFELTSAGLTYAPPLKRKVDKVTVVNQGVNTSWNSSKGYNEFFTTHGHRDYVMPATPVLNPTLVQRVWVYSSEIPGYTMGYSVPDATYTIVQNGQVILPEGYREKDPFNLVYDYTVEGGQALQIGYYAIPAAPGSRYNGPVAHVNGPATLTVSFSDGSIAEFDVIIDEPVPTIVSAPTMAGGTLTVAASSITPAPGGMFSTSVILEQLSTGCNFMEPFPNYSTPGQVSITLPSLSGRGCQPGEFIGRFDKIDSYGVRIETVHFKFNVGS